MKMKTIAYLLLAFSAFTLVACSSDKKDNSKTSGSTSDTQQVENQAKDKKIKRILVFLIMEVIIVYKESMRKS